MRGIILSVSTLLLGCCNNYIMDILQCITMVSDIIPLTEQIQGMHLLLAPLAQEKWSTTISSSDLISKPGSS